jgi:hypothetical protein
MALVLWLARLLPVVVLFGMPAYEKIAARTARHPDARVLLDPARDADGFTYAWTSDFFRDSLRDATDTVFWLIVFCWLLVTVLAGGIVTRLVHGGGLKGGLFLAECGRYAGRFLRLAFLSAVVLYAMDAACNAIWSARHDEIATLQHTQDHELQSSWMRGILFLVGVYLVGLIHNYARIDMVAHERRSAVLCFLRGLGALVRHLPALLVVELGVLLMAGVAAVLGWVVLKGANPLHADASWLAVGVFLFLAAAVSYLRSGVEVGALASRCTVLAPPAAPESIASQIEAVLGDA